MGGIIDVVVIGIIVVGAYYAFSTGLLSDVIENITGGLKGIGPGITTPGSGGGGGSAISSGKCSGTVLKPDHQGSSKRWESGDIPGDPDAYEVTWCGTFSGDDLTFKMYGPSHSGSACCWCVMHVKEDGKMVAGGEGPHPDSNCEHGGSSKGGGGKAECYRAVVKPGPVQEGYALVNGKWELRASYSGPCGCSKKSSKKTGNTLMVRNDGSIKTTCASVKPLGGGSGSAYARAMYARSMYARRAGFDRIGVH